MTAEKRKRLKSVKYVNNPISKPDSEREKGVQADRSLVVSRARPTFCQFCKIRHSSLACPVVNPVQTTSLPASLPASDDQTRNPPTNPRTLRDFKVKSKSSRLERHVERMWLRGRIKMMISAIFIHKCDLMSDEVK